MSCKLWRAAGPCRRSASAAACAISIESIESKEIERIDSFDSLDCLDSLDIGGALAGGSGTFQALLPPQLTAYHLPLTTYHSPLTTYHSPLTTHHLPLTAFTYYFSLAFSFTACQTAFCTSLVGAGAQPSITARR